MCLFFKKLQIPLIIKSTLLVELSLKDCKVQSETLIILYLHKVQAGEQRLKIPCAWNGEGLAEEGEVGCRCSLSLSTGGCCEQKQGADPSVCVDEEDEAGAPPVLCGCAGAGGEDISLGLFPK